jgi:uncharacterized protein (TIGR02265 family)
LIGVVKALRSHCPRSLNLAPQHLRHYFDDRVLAGAWYPEADFRDLTLLLGRMLAPSVKGNVWRLIGALGAERDFAGTYRAVIRLGDVEGTLRRFPEGWRLYRDAAKMVIEEVLPGFARVALYDYAVMCQELAELNGAYLEGAVRAAGAQDVRVEVVRCDAISARWELFWQAVPAV